MCLFEHRRTIVPIDPVESLSWSSTGDYLKYDGSSADTNGEYATMNGNIG